MDSAVVELAYAVDTFYFLVSGVLVMWMAAGFAMLEAGLVRGKNTAEILTKNVALFAIASIMYLLVGYKLMYPGDGVSAWWPGLSFLIGEDNTAEAVLASGGDTYYSGMSDFFFQVVFVATAMSIVSGAVAERMKLWAFLAFAVIMTGFIYPLWMGWFGFNGGSELKISDVGEANAVAKIFVNTNAAAAGGVVAALITSSLMFRKADLTMVLNGALAGLVSITAEPLAPSPLAATFIGAIGGVIVVFSIMARIQRRRHRRVWPRSLSGVHDSLSVA